MLDDKQYKAKRRTTQKRQAHKADPENILGLFNIVASKRLLENVYLLSLTLSVPRLIESGPDGGVNTQQADTNRPTNLSRNCLRRLKP
jgi:hypothetical protein